VSHTVRTPSRIVEAIKLDGVVPKVTVKGFPRLGPSHLQRMVDSGHTCSDCLKSNHHHRRHSRYKTASDIKPMEVVHCDIIAMPRCVPGQQKQMDTFFPENRNEEYLWAGYSFSGNPPYTSDVITKTLNKALRHFQPKPIPISCISFNK